MDSLSGVAARIQQIESLFYDDRVRQAFDHLIKLEMDYASNELVAEECEKCNLENFFQGQLASTLRSDMILLDKYFKAFDDIQTWNLIKQKGTMKSWLKQEPGVSSVLLAGECIIEAPIFNSLAIFAEVDLFNKWMPSLDFVKQLKQVSKFRRILHYSFKLPLFISNRDFVCSAVANVDKKNRAVVFPLTACQQGELFGVEVPGPGKAVRVDMRVGCVGFQYLGENKNRFRVLLQVDPLLKLIPMMVINWGTKQVIFEFLRILTKMSTNLDDVYKKRIREDKDGIYKEARNRLAELLDEEIVIPFLEEGE